MSEGNYHLQDQPIPPGFQIYEERVEVAGVGFRRDDAAAFSKANNKWLELERDLANRHDPNAIRVIGCCKGFFGTNRYFVGYIPAGLARIVVEKQLYGKLQARLLKTYVGTSGYVEILLQLLGPSGQKSLYLQKPSNPNAHYTERLDELKGLIKNDPGQAIEELLKVIATIEKEAKKRPGLGVAPWYYERLAVLYKKEKRYEDEIAILERYASQPHAPGATGPKLLARLEMARLSNSKRGAKQVP